MDVNVCISTHLCVLLCLSVCDSVFECETERGTVDAEALCLLKAAVPSTTIFVTCSESVVPDSNGAPPLPEISLEVSPPPGG